MSAAYKPPAGPPPSAGVLAKYVLAYARASNLAEGTESGEHEIEWLPAIPPPRPGKRNERFRDLIDLLLMEALVVDYQDLRKSCEHVFKTRSTHAWPPPLDLPEHWIDPINRLIRELELPIADAHAGLVRVRQFVDQILSSTETTNGNLR